MRNCRSADCDTDYFFVICTFHLKLQRASGHFQKTPKFKIEELKDEEKRQKYTTKLTGKLNEKKEYERKVSWNIIKKLILKATFSTQGEPKKQENKWFNSDFRKAIEKKVELAKETSSLRPREAKKIMKQNGPCKEKKKLHK